MSICVLDTETTGLLPETADIVELATVTIPKMDIFHSLVKPTVPIELKAMAAHHIKERAVACAPHVKSVFGSSHLWEAKFLVAHNAEFDRGFIEKPNLLPKLPWVCTWRCARQLWPEAPSFSNQVLRYWLDGLDDELYLGQGKKIMELPPHRALPDAWVTAHILNRMLVYHTIKELVELSTKPILGTTISFGMHRDMPWEKVPKSYLRWIMKENEKSKKDPTKTGFDSDTIYTVKHWLEYCPHCSNGCKKCNMTGFKYPLVAGEVA